MSSACAHCISPLIVSLSGLYGKHNLFIVFSRGLNIHAMQSGSSVGQLQVTRSGLISKRDSSYTGQIDVYAAYIFNAAGREENITGCKWPKNILKSL